MSGRMVKRVLQEQKPVKAADDGSESEDDLRSQAQTAKKMNMFDLLGSQDNEDDDDADEEEDAREAVVVEKKVAPAVTVTKSKKKKSKGKKKGGKTLNPAAAAAAEESVDELLEKLALHRHGEATSTSETTTSWPGSHVSDVLAVDPRHLRAEDELRRIFGSKVINAVEKSGEGSGLLSGGRRRQPSRRGGRNLLKKSLLVTPLENWPRLEAGLSMECTDQKEGLSFFRYGFSSSYQEVQRRYEDCVASHDPHTLAKLVNHHPYHIDSLLALSEVCKDLGEVQQSAELLERCIYALECAWHPGFNATTGKCRLEYGWDPNKPLFYALFKHMQHLGRRGCHRTALEVCKLILSLDSDDPMGALFCIDYFALRAEQYEWLQRFAREYSSESSLPLLPNFSFSLALAQFHIEASRSSARTSSDKRQPLQQPESDEPSSSSLVQQALMLHPSVLRKIVDKAPIKEDAAWTKILSHSYFSSATPGGPTLEHLINIYTERNYLIWRAPDVQAWLKRAAQAVTDRAEAGNDGGELANWATVRQEAFSADQNEYKHLLLSEFSDSGTTSTLPPEEMQHLVFGAGPGGGPGGLMMPPQDVLAGMQDVDVEGGNAALLFLRSLLEHGIHLDALPPIGDTEIDVDLVGELDDDEDSDYYGADYEM